MKSKNRVASILKVYAWFNGFVGLLLSFLLVDYFESGTIFILAMVIAINFVIYAFGEVIQLLHDIKENTANKTPVIRNIVDDIEANLPEI